MDALKAVPQFFFDVIGRVVPGSVAMFLLHFFADPEWKEWTNFVQGLLADFDDGDIPSTFIVLVLFLSAYAIGHIISPLTKLIQWVGERVSKRKTIKGTAESEVYAWLRLHWPEGGAHCAKLRAEFTMYNGLSGVFFLAVPAAAYWETLSPERALLFITLSIFMAYRGREGRDTFSKNIRFFQKAAEGNTQLPGSLPAARRVGTLPVE